MGTFENFLAVFKDTQLLWISKSDSVPVALRVAGFAYAHVLVAREHLMIASRPLKCIHVSPVAFVLCLCMCDCRGAKGLVVGMNDHGRVECWYMGTDPGVPHAAAHADTKELDYEEMDQEHRKLLKTIRDASNDATVEPTDRLVIRTQVSSVLDPPRPDDAEDDIHAEDCARDEAGNAVTITVRTRTLRSNRVVHLLCMCPRTVASG
jgi:hypothetical protein